MAILSRLSIAGLATVVVVSALLIGAAGAQADTAPPNASTPKTVAADALTAPQINGVVWTQLIVGNTVYVGGEFTRARPSGSAAGSNEVTRNNLMAYNLSTGVMTAFNPNLNGAVRALAVSSDKTRVFVGGSFTTVGGVTRYRIAAFDAATGGLISSWAPVLNGNVKALDVAGGVLYAGGVFTTAANQTRTKIAAFSTSTGALQAWQGNVAGGNVNALTAAQDGSKVIIGGSFTSYNGGTNPGYGLAATSAATGASLPWKVNSIVRNAGVNGAILSLTSDANGVFATGYDFGSGANFEGTVRSSWSDGSVLWLEDCHGDTYSAVPVNDVVYTTAHAHFCGNIGGYGETNPRSYHRTLTFTMNATGLVTRNTTGNYTNFEGNPRPTLLAWYPEINTGTYTGQGQGPWNVTANSQYVLYAGEFTIVNNKKQQGLTRFAVSTIAPNKEGPRLQGADFVPTVTSPSSGTARLTWTSNYDRDNELLTYQVLRNGVSVKTLTGLSVDWKRPVITWTDSGLQGGATYSYQLKVSDPFGNTRTGDAVSVRISGSTQAASPTAAFDATATQLFVAVDGSPSSGGGGAITSYSWAFGDGATGTAMTQTHKYAAPGTYKISLTVRNDSGASAMTEKSVVVTQTAPPPDPQPGADIARDAFERSVSNGLGTADVGGPWSTTGPASGYAVGGGEAALQSSVAGAMETAYLRSVAATSTDSRVAFTLRQSPSGAGVYVALLGRAIGSDDYRARVRLNVDGTSSLQLMHGGTSLKSVSLPGLNAAVGDQVVLRLTVSGTSPTTLSAKAWKTGQAEPGWQLTGTDTTSGMQSAGGVGLSLYLSSSATVVPLTASFDDLLVKSAG
ncbi:PKD domain-containing protein [Glaciibacter sp. 2TAF33]|uniref:PKD domain-containing protein n=1 Tax=Glaciibacter sp. 2TAF33 TaxID=3233015 RepID=UPI003F930DB6